MDKKFAEVAFAIDPTPAKILTDIDMSLQSDEQNDSFDKLLAQLYSCDETGVSDTPLAKYLGKNCSPELRQFITDNLLQVATPIVPNFGDNLSDDDLFALSPSYTDTQDTYRARVKDYIDAKYKEDFEKELNKKSKEPKSNVNE